MTTDIIGIYFDFFGTLIDSKYAISNIWSRIAKKLGKEIRYDNPRIWKGMQKHREEAEKLKKRLNVNYMNYSQEDWDYLNSFVLGIIGVDTKGTSEIISEEFNKFFFEYYRLYPGSRETLEQIKIKNIKIGLHTHAPREDCQLKMKELKIFEFFDIFIHTQDYGYNKSHIEIYQIALDAMKTRNPKKIYHVGDDLELDVNMAQKIGMIPILFDPYNLYSLKDIRVIRGLPEIMRFL
ncbi:MAG: HAD family hydrolase [Promethearchaeota archaeon]